MSKYIIVREYLESDGRLSYFPYGGVDSDLQTARDRACRLSIQDNATLCVAQLLYRSTVKTYTEEERLDDSALVYRGTVKAEEEHADDGAL